MADPPTSRIPRVLVLLAAIGLFVLVGIYQCGQPIYPVDEPLRDVVARVGGQIVGTLLLLAAWLTFLFLWRWWAGPWNGGESRQ